MENADSQVAVIGLAAFTFAYLRPTWALALFAVALAWQGATRGPRRLGLPPGPPPKPIIGNLFDMCLTGLWVEARKWAQQYGDVVYVHIFGQGLLFLNSRQAVVDLLEKRGAIYSDKPKTVMAGELCGCSDMVGLTPYGDRLRRQRRLYLQALGPNAVKSYYPLLEAQTSNLLKGILNNPEDSEALMNTYTGSLTLLITYGHRVKSSADPLLKMANTALDVLANEIAAAGKIWLVDMMPFLKHMPLWMPGAGFKRKAAEWKDLMTRFVNEPYESVKQQMKNGTAEQSYCSMLLEDATQGKGIEKGVSDERDFDIRWTANSLYAASFDTNIAAIQHFVYAMIQHPDVLAKAQREIDHVVGTGRLPTFTDRESLPYVNAVYFETLRWATPVPLGLPRLITEDNVYRDMFIPKGTLVFGNAYNMTRDPELFPNPDEFEPERYFAELVDSETIAKRDPRQFVFGFGRRGCPGQYIIDASMWVMLASVMAAFDVRKAVDDYGKIIEPEYQYNNSIFTTLKPFKYDIRPRSAQAVKLVREAKGLAD